MNCRFWERERLNDCVLEDQSLETLTLTPTVLLSINCLKDHHFKQVIWFGVLTLHIALHIIKQVACPRPQMCKCHFPLDPLYFIWLSSIILIIILHFSSFIINVLAISKIVHAINWILIIELNSRCCPSSPQMLKDEEDKKCKEQKSNSRTDDNSHRSIIRGVSWVGWS